MRERECRQTTVDIDIERCVSDYRNMSDSSTNMEWKLLEPSSVALLNTLQRNVCSTVFYRRTGFKCVVVKWLYFQDFEKIAFLIIAFIACDRLPVCTIYFILHFKDYNLGKTSQSAIFRLSHLKPVLPTVHWNPSWRHLLHEVNYTLLNWHIYMHIRIWIT